MAVEHRCCGANFFIHIAFVVLLVLFAGLMSGLTLGLMSLSLVDLEVLAKSGTPQDRKHAARILPVVQKQHLLLCTLLICNAAAMEALPIVLDGLVSAWGAILISVTLVLLFGEIIPQSVCSRHGLAIGAAVAPLVRVLEWLCFPIAYPISKLLDFILGDGHVALFRRAELKTLVNLHGNAAGKGGELTHDETTIITGALELTEKKAKDSMTPISETFAIDIHEKLDRELMGKILEEGHSRVPVYFDKPTNIIGLILVKNLLCIDPDDEVPIRRVTIRKIPRVHEDMPLYDILNEFQKGHSHMAVVVRQGIQQPSIHGEVNSSHSNVVVQTNPTKEPNLNGDEKQAITAEQPSIHGNDVRVDVDGDMANEKSLKGLNSRLRVKSYPPNLGSTGGCGRSRKWSRDGIADILHIPEQLLPTVSEEEEAIGIITMEDVIEELLQEEIFDETDHQEEG